MSIDKEDSENTEYPPGPYCAVMGSLAVGFKLHGPFDSVDLAVAWAEKNVPKLGHCSVLPLLPP